MICLLVVPNAFAQTAIIGTLLVAEFASSIAVLLTRTERTVLSIALWTAFPLHSNDSLTDQRFAHTALTLFTAIVALAHRAAFLDPLFAVLEFLLMRLRIARWLTAFVRGTTVTRPHTSVHRLHNHLTGCANWKFTFRIANAILVDAAMFQLGWGGFAFVQVSNVKVAGYDLYGVASL